MKKKNLSLYFLSLFVPGLISALCLAQQAHNSGANSPRAVPPSMTMQEQRQWQRYTAKGEEFSVAMPEQPIIYSFYRPQQRDFQLSLSDTRKEVRLYDAYSDGAVYIVMSSDNPKGEEALDVFINEFSQYPVFHDGLTYEREVTRNNFKGKQYRVKSAQVTGIVQFYQTRNHVYIFEVVEDIFARSSMEQFLSTLTLDGKPKGKDMAEGLKEAFANPQASPTPASSETPSQTVTQMQTFAPKEVLRKAVVIVKPEPQYTEDARKRGIAGVVVLKAVFSSSGKITNIRAVSGLPYGLTEKAIVAARMMRFIPAVKEGRYVSQYIQIEYNFDLY